MNTKIILIILVALGIGLGGGYALGAGKSAPIQEGHTMSDGSIINGMQGSMDNMMAGLEGKTGDEFDKAFLSEMIMHHEGAVQMAEAALQYAKHEEIKTMANVIISAQTTEIRQMQDWQVSWYGSQQAPTSGGTPHHAQ